MTKLVNPVPLFLDGRGALLDAGYIYVGTAGTDPEVGANQVDLFWDKPLTVPAAQPLRTLGGVIVNGGDVADVYFEEPDFSVTIRDADGQLVLAKSSAFDLGGTQFQPLDSDLSAIAALATTAFGRNLLILANQAALQAAAGIGSAGLLPVATAAQFRSNTADKVLDTDGVWGAAQTVPLASNAGTIAVDFSTGFNFVIGMNSSPLTLGNPTSGKPGQTGFIEIYQDATGNRILNFGPNWKFAGGTDPVLSTAANALDLLHYQVLNDGLSVFASLTKAVS